MEERIVRCVSVGRTVFALVAGNGPDHWSIIRGGKVKPETFTELPQAVGFAVQMLEQTGQLEEAHLLSAYQSHAQAAARAWTREDQ